MSRYQRTEPAYGTQVDEPVNPQYAMNSYILEWWTAQHDTLLKSQIQEKQWVWYIEIFKEIECITSASTLENWKKTDPICSEYAWYNVLNYFAIARAQKIGFTKNMRRPAWKTCPLCRQEFVEDSLPYPMIKRLGIEDLDFCAPCLSTRVYQQTGDSTATEEHVISYVKELTETLQRIPPQGFGEGLKDFHGLDAQERYDILRLLGRKPTIERTKELFGSWLNALVQSNVLENGARRTSRGTHCIAKDGHVCLSLGEKTIDDLLFSNGILHEKEPHYPEGQYRADFAVDGIFIEYFGLKGNPDYDKKTKFKQKLCKKHGIKLISIYPEDLVSRKKLSGKIGRGLSLSDEIN